MTWLDCSTDAAQDRAATALCLAICVIWLKSVDALVHLGLLEQRLSRKVIHIGTGVIFVLTWPNFSSSESAPYYAAVVPLLITLQFAAIGLGIWKDPKAVASLTRTGNPREILRGPLYYGLIFIVCTVFFWRNSPAGILGLMTLCGGDGLAEIIGRRYGRVKLPFSERKSWAGSAGFLFGSFTLGFTFLELFNWLGYFDPELGTSLQTSLFVGLVCIVAAMVEALPVADLDNIFVPLSSMLLARQLFGR